MRRPFRDGDGWVYCRALATTEFYVPASGAWERGPQVRHAAVDVIQLADGRLLAVGDFDVPNRPPGPEAQLLDPTAAESTWQLGGGFKKAGDGSTDYYPSPTPEIFDPESETWSVTGPMPHYVMQEGAMVKLPSGAALFTGGSVNGKLPEEEFVAIPAAQLFPGAPAVQQ